MTWLAPLGFLGLIGLIVLIIIYLIKPNYQNKIISSTFIWKLSLKYKRKKIPINKLRNILLFICQVLIICIAAAILARPVIAEEAEPKEKIIILDASESMTAESGGVTRFERAVEEIKKVTDSVLDSNGKISIILAHDNASFIVQSADSTQRKDIIEALNDLVDPSNTTACTYGTPDIDGAIKLAERITQSTPDVEVLLYTDTTYIDHGNVKVVPVSDVSDWNAAILDVRAINDEHYYRFEIDVACYGRDADISVYCNIVGAITGNGEIKEDITSVINVRCDGDAIQTIILAKPKDDESETDERIDEEIAVSGYESVYVYLNEDDSLADDNAFYLYGGEKLPLRIQYYSPLANNFFATTLMVLRDRLKYRWDIEIVEVKGEDAVPESEGFDVYIYEHIMPATLPTDGFVILANPDELPSNSGLRLGATVSIYNEEKTYLENGEAHPITNGISASDITVSQYTKVTSYDGYTPLYYLNGDPVMLVKNEPDQKIAVMSFSLHYSNLPIILGRFPLLMYRMLEYFVPSTVTEYVFDINESISLNSRSEYLDIVGPATDDNFTEFPSTIKLTTPGVYTVIQKPISGEDVVENFYVKIPAAESNINTVEDTLTNPFFYEESGIDDFDLLLYFAIALVTFLFAEWWLNTREQF